MIIKFIANLLHNIKAKAAGHFIQPGQAYKIIVHKIIFLQLDTVRVLHDCS